MKINIQTLGCKVNQYETQALEKLFAERGYEISDSPEECDICVVNTCAVTAESGRKSCQAIRRTRRMNPSALIAVCGCFSQIDPDEVAALDVDLIAGSGDRLAFVDDIEKLCEDRVRRINIDDPLKRRTFEKLPAGNLSGRTRAMLKIQDGCSNFCSYCVIPYARGPVRSLPVADAASEAEKLASRGFSELVVTGIEISSYGVDLKDGSSLIDVIFEISRSAPDSRIHLGSLEPRTATDEFCRALSRLPNICDHFHLSLQSGSDTVLSRMRRKYDTALFYESVCNLRRYFPGCGVTADMIVGFPGETENEFAESLEFVRKCAFSAMHIFPYSPRPGTAAAKMDGQIEKRVKHERAAVASALAKELEDDFLRSCVGKKLSVLFEREKDGVSVGHASNYASVAVKARNLRNTILPVQIIGVGDGVLLGELTHPTV